MSLCVPTCAAATDFFDRLFAYLFVLFYLSTWQSLTISLDEKHRQAKQLEQFLYSLPDTNQDGLITRSEVTRDHLWITFVLLPNLLVMLYMSALPLRDTLCKSSLRSVLAMDVRGSRNTALRRHHREIRPRDLFFLYKGVTPGLPLVLRTDGERK